MKQVHIVIPDLFLPESMAIEVCAHLKLPTLELLLARSKKQFLKTDSLDAWLCQTFEVPEMSIAPVTMATDGIDPHASYWMRADPVHLRLNNAQMILQTNVSINLEEAKQLCKSVNEHFAGSGMEFFAAHPQRWYVRLDEHPQLDTHSSYQVEGRDSRPYLPRGESALKWHGVMNEIQMLLYGHPISQKCKTRGGLPVNSVWFWGGGTSVTLARPFDLLLSDSDLASAFAHAAKIQLSNISVDSSKIENSLFVWEAASVALRRGDYYSWRQSILKFEQECLSPLLQLLRQGKLKKITLDVLQEDNSRRFELTHPRLWQAWKRPRALANYSLV